MADLSKATNIKMVNPYQSITRLMEAGGAVSPGDLVYQRASDGKVLRCDADVNASSFAIGMVITRATNTAFMGHNPPYAAGDKVAVLYQGFVSGFTVALADLNKTLWVSTTAGAIELVEPATSGDTAFPVGRAVQVGSDNSGVLWINPPNERAAANA